MVFCYRSPSRLRCWGWDLTRTQVCLLQMGTTCYLPVFAPGRALFPRRAGFLYPDCTGRAGGTNRRTKRVVSSPRKPRSPTPRAAADIPVLEGVMGVAVGGKEIWSPRGGAKQYMSTCVSCVGEALGSGNLSGAFPLSRLRGAKRSLHQGLWESHPSGRGMTWMSGTTGRGLRPQEEVWHHSVLGPKGSSKLPEQNKWINWTSLKLRSSALQKAVLREWKHEPQIGRKYLQNTYLIKDWYPKFVLQKLFLAFNNKKTNNPIKTRAKDLNRYLSKEKRQS